MANPNKLPTREKPSTIPGPLTLLKPIMPYLITFGALFTAIVAFWLWGVVHINPGEIGIVISKTGKEIGKEKIVVEEGEKGVRRHILSEGRYWFFPITYEVHVVGDSRRTRDSDFVLKVNKYKTSPFHFNCSNKACRKTIRLDVSRLRKEIDCFFCRKTTTITNDMWSRAKIPSRTMYYEPLDSSELSAQNLKNVGGKWGVLGTLEIKPGEFGVVNCKYGWPDTKNTLNLGQIVSKGARGIWKDPVPPGTYRFHPKVYEISVYPELEVPPGFMGVVTVKQGKELPSGRLLAREGEKGLLEEVLPPGKYRLNPVLYDVELAPEVFIGPKEIGTVRALDGERLPEGEGQQQLAEIGQKGVWKKVLSPGTYRLNPKAYEITVEKAVIIKPGQIGVKISKIGKELPPGESLATPGYKGVLKDVLVPGTYRLNPIEFIVELHNEVRIEHGHGGVQISKVGRSRAKKVGEKFTLVEEGEQGVMREVLPPGRYYINPFEREVKIVDIRSHIYSMHGDDAIKFPARGFDIKVNTLIEWQIDPTRLPEVIMTIGGPKEIVGTVIRQTAREIGRLEGSRFSAQQLVFGDSREVFQKTFDEQLKNYCEKKGILIHRVLFENIEIPENIRRPINQKEIAKQEKAKNEQKKETAKSAAALAEEEQKVNQAREKVLAETSKIVAELNAERVKAIAEISAEKEKDIISIGKERAKVEADKEKKVAEVAAELLQEIAGINKARDLITAETGKKVAMIGLNQARFEAKSIEVLNDAKAYGAQIKYLADGGFKLKIQAWSEVMESLAKNKTMVPDQLIQLNSKNGNGAGMLDAFMALMTKEMAEKAKKEQNSNNK